MLFLTDEQHQEVLRRLTDLGKKATTISLHQEGVEYTSLMVCFLLHNLSSADAILRLANSYGNTWFPVTVGYTIARTMFETEVIAHYITQKPKERSRQYINYGAVLKKRNMDACSVHRESKDPQWCEAMNYMWQQCWAMRELQINEKYNMVSQQYMQTNRKGKTNVFKNWSGKSLRQMASEVNHVEAYDIFYAELSSFSHADVHLADRYLNLKADDLLWTQRAREEDVGNVYRNAASFFTCYLELFGKQFNMWSKEDIENCWDISK